MAACERMSIRTLAAAFAISALATPALAAEVNPCTPLAGLVRQARNDFQSLKVKKLDAGTCKFARGEFRCSWRFPGDQFAVAEAQSGHVEHCALAQPGVEAIASKKGETAFALEDDLTLYVAAPKIDMGDWTVELRLVEAAPKQ